MRSAGGSRLEVLAPGPLTTVQDLGRPGLAHLGVSPSGALDRRSAVLANALVGNPPGAALLETTLSGPRFRVLGAGSIALAVAGAPVVVTIDGLTVDPTRVIQVPSGAVVHVRTCTSGIRSYLAVRGGIAVEAVLGSRSWDVLSGLGPPPLRTGDVLPIGAVPPVGDEPPVGNLPAVGPAVGFGREPIDPEPVLPIVLGPRHDWFTAAAVALLTSTTWQVGPASNRIGLRLSGPALQRVRPQQLPSEAVVTGGIQVPPDGQPVLFLADHPTTGGYPVIAVADQDALHHAAQARPGTTLRFTLAPGWLEP